MPSRSGSAITAAGCLAHVAHHVASDQDARAKHV